MRYNTTNDGPPPALRGIADRSWQARGACKDLSTARSEKLFFPRKRDHASIAEAKRFCAQCPVKKDCFNYALDNEIRRGIWGGLTEAERSPWHAKITKRLDYSRVRAALMGRDVDLSTPERETVIRHAYLRGWNAERLAYLLQSDLNWIRDQLREAGHAITDRDRFWGLYDEEVQEDDAATTADNKPDEKDKDDEEEVTTSSPVPPQVHTQDLINSLGKAA
ncbi:WhiB family transcriptional regulator [Streptomyces sp. NPDC056178]|uniref:WhiB family transcriptional regulator n=1 Tax=unclassified Streptomyces TaxID=2593676 RepID=UPI0035DD5998